MFPRCKVRVTGGFVLLAAWFAAASGWRPLAAVLLAAGVHELGHLLVLALLGAETMSLRLSALGAELETDAARLSYGGELAAVLAGPAANLLCAAALTALHDKYYTLIGANIILSVFNLLPVRPLDGGRALELLVSWLAGPTAGERVSRFAGWVFGTALAVFLGWLMWKGGGNLWLLPAWAAAVSWGLRPWLAGGYSQRS